MVATVANAWSFWFNYGLDRVLPRRCLWLLISRHSTPVTEMLHACSELILFVRRGGMCRRLLVSHPSLLRIAFCCRCRLHHSARDQHCNPILRKTARSLSLGMVPHSTPWGILHGDSLGQSRICPSHGSMGTKVLGQAPTRGRN